MASSMTWLVLGGAAAMIGMPLTIRWWLRDEPGVPTPNWLRVAVGSAMIAMIAGGNALMFGFE